MTASLPFSKSRRVGDTLYLSGELGFAEDGTLSGDIGEQTSRTLARIEGTLKAEGFTMADVVSATCYLTDKGDFAAFNAAYAPWFQDPLPVRTTVECDLMIDAKVEITVIAAKAR